ncbi:hypothetical protein VIGAN_02195300 [Vigna angularis var. angularis]|uniref:Uncharacterized protein n=1 Tax=Vigna angularis var. angularis TaxID=157739 RepID=A0A0S3REL3_PHAAN|nr:hypothetical protein VIGAN_02195300 [Vigna angularis var. angularis]
MPPLSRICEALRSMTMEENTNKMIELVNVAMSISNYRSLVKKPYYNLAGRLKFFISLRCNLWLVFLLYSSEDKKMEMIEYLIFG